MKRGLILVAVLFGAWLRLAWLGDQIPTGDEIHPIESLRQSLGFVLTHFQRPDNCIPISALCNVLASSVGLDEWGLRSLSFVPGILLLLVAARATKQYLTPIERWLLVLVLASSPLLVFWSRIGRPYSAISLLGVLAVVAYLKYGRTRKWSWALGSAACQVGMFWFSPTTLAALISLALAAAVHGWSSGGPGLRIGQRARAGPAQLAPSFLAGVLALVLLGVALPSLWELLHYEQTFSPSPTRWTWMQFTQLVSGFSAIDSPGDRWLTLIPVALMVAGVVRFGAVQRALALPMLLLLFTSPVLYTLLEFQGLGVGTVLARYQAATIPFFLFLVVYGAGAILSVLGRVSVPVARIGAAGAVVALAAHVWFGPLRSGIGPEHPFGLTHSRLFDRVTLAESLEQRHLPPFYQQLSGIEPLVLLEACDDPRLIGAIATYAEVHGGRVVRCNFAQLRDDLQLAFHTFRYRTEDLPSQLAMGEYVVVHLLPGAELNYFMNGPGGEAKRGIGPDVLRLARYCREQYGEPVYRDFFLQVYGSAASGARGFTSPGLDPPRRERPAR